MKALEHADVPTTPSLCRDLTHGSPGSCVVSLLLVPSRLPADSLPLVKRCPGSTLRNQVLPASPETVGLAAGRVLEVALGPKAEGKKTPKGEAGWRSEVTEPLHPATSFGT